MTASSSGASDLEMQLLESVSVRLAENEREPGADLPNLKVARRAAIDRFEVEYVRNLLQKAGGNVTRAAALADVSRQIIHKLIARHGL
jgi:transcriptional regulator of acetoin/glycerol metabolism